MGMTPDDVRYQHLKETVDRLERDHDEAIRVMEQRLHDFERGLERRFEDFVLKIVFESYRDRLDDRFKPLERVVYSIVGVVLLAVLTALVATVVRSGGVG